MPKPCNEAASGLIWPVRMASPASAGLLSLAEYIQHRHPDGVSIATRQVNRQKVSRPYRHLPQRGSRRALAILEVVTGAAGLAGGLLLVVAPDGSLLHADPAVLAGTRFSSWRIPGVLLAVLVGGGFLAIGAWQWRLHRHAPELSMLAGVGLIAFEASELAWIRFQPLEAVFAIVGASVTGIAWQVGRRPGGSSDPSSDPAVT